MSRAYFLEVPIYRISPKLYIQEIEDEKSTFYINIQNNHNLSHERVLSLFKSSKDEWKYNEIIGGLWFWYDGLIKVDLYLTSRRISKVLKNKDIAHKWKIHELNVGHKSNWEIFNIINEYLDFLQQDRFKKNYISKDSFIKLGRFIDYISLFRNLK